jgi:hypothetical protein
MANFLDFLFGGGDQKVTTKTELPKWYEQAAKQLIKQGFSAGDWYGKPYLGQTYAGLTPEQRLAIRKTMGNIGSTNGAYDEAMDATRGIFGYQPDQVKESFKAQGVNPGSFLRMNVNDYMDPNIKYVEKAALGRLEDQRLQAQNGNADAAITSGAFGGSRQGVVEGVTNAESAKAAGELSANLRSNAYNSATSLMEQELARRAQVGLANQNADLTAQGMGLQGQIANQNAGANAAQLWLQGANQLGAQATDKQQGFLQSLQAALAGGGMLQANNQGKLNQQIGRYDAIRNYPMQIWNTKLSALSGTQLPTMQTQTTPTSGNWLAGGLGGALTGASLFGAGGALAGTLSPGIGTLLGGGLGMLLSDRRAKTNIEKVGKDPKTGVPLYAYDYKADVQAARKSGRPMPPKRVGPMAQDLEKFKPGSTQRVGGKLVVTNLGFGG